MKKTLIVLTLALVLLAAGSAFAEMGKFGAAFKVGGDFIGEWGGDSVPTDLDTDDSVSIAAEAFYKFTPYVDAGAGVQYLFEREIDTSPGWKFWFLPVYGMLRVHPEMSNITPYGIIQLGYAFHGGNSAYFGNLDTGGGFYWGGGGGLIIKEHFLVEALYSVSRGSVEVAPGTDFDVEHSRLTLSVGVTF